MLSPWKTASQTCHASLSLYNDSPYDRFFHFNPALGRVVHQHATLSDLLAMPEGNLGYKLGAFVRNPYDRAYSGFIQIQRDFQSQPRLDITPRWISDLIKSQIGMNMTRVIAAGFDFDRWIDSVPDYEFFDSGKNTNMPLHPAHYWTQVEGHKVDFIGKVENFADDFAAFCEFVDIEIPFIQSENVTEGERSASIGFSRYAEKMSRRSLDRINELFAKDFELFDYNKL